MEIHVDAAKTAQPRILDLFSQARKEGRPLFISAPMVRYSKLPYRLLMRDYRVDVTYTPMMLAHEFIRSEHARDSDFTTCNEERQPTDDGRDHVLIAQFASSDSTEFARAAELIEPWVDGVNLNCGCPQSWAIKEGVGCSLMSSPELVAEMVRAAKARLSPSKSVSCKIRIAKDLNETKKWIEIVEASGIDYITIHGRTRSQRSSTPPDYEAIRILKTLTKVPVIANGDAYSLEDVTRIASITGVDGVMAARGMLENPSLFAGDIISEAQKIHRFMKYVIDCPIPFPLVLHHLYDMTTKSKISKKDRRRLMECRDLIDLIDFVEEHWGLPP